MRILIVDDHPLVIEGLKALVCERRDTEVVGQAQNGEAAVKCMQELKPDLVIMDITMPKMNGIEAMRQISLACPSVKIIVLSMNADDTIVKEALKAGCLAYVLKSGVYEEISTALDAVVNGDYYLSPEIANVVINSHLCPSFNRTTDKGLNLLSGREKQILQLVTEGYSTKEIGLHLHLSPKTVDSTRRNIMEKLDLHTVPELTRFAVSAGLTSVDF
ncbi:MAG: response regulator transcription factor [Phycisphaerae bacterium]|nr:response regulator transcription factor [Phycisphaerae bacterium]